MSVAARHYQAVQRTVAAPDPIVQHAELVRRIAHHLAARLPASVEIDDLVQAGMIALFDSLKRFDPASDIQFETFAMQRVRGAMLDELRSGDWMPRSVRKNQRTIERAISRLEHGLQRAPTETEIASELGMELGDYQRMLGEARGGQLIYLDEVGERDGDEDYLERHHPSQEPDPLQTLSDGRFRQALVAAIQDLPEREKLVIALYYYENLTLREIGEVLGVTESRVSQLHTKAVLRLKSRLQDDDEL